MQHTAPLICLVSAQFAPSRGGVEQYTQNLGLALLHRGYRVLVLCQNTADVIEEEWIDGLQVLRFPCIPLMNGRFPLPKYGKAWTRCLRRIYELAPNYMLVNTRIYPFCLHMLRFAKKQKIHAVLLDHSSGHLSLENPLLAFLIAQYEHILTFFIKRNCADFYSVSKNGVAWLKHYGIQARGVLYNAVDLDKINRICKEHNFSRLPERPFSKSNFSVLYAGRLLPEKGVKKLISAAQLAHEENEDCVLTFVGDGPLYKELKELQSSTVRVLGSVPFEEVLQHMSENEVFVLPTDYKEGFPTSILEAAAMGCYCITTTMGGSKELLTDRDYGVILEENTAENLKKELIWAKHNTEKRVQIAKNAQKQVEQYFTWENTAKAFLTAFSLPEKAETQNTTS